MTRRYLCERCGGTGVQPAGCWTGTAYDSPSCPCDMCDGTGELGEVKASTVQSCQTCGGSGWYRYDDHHMTICGECCRHDSGWVELDECQAGYIAGEDNACCRAGCGRLRREL